MEPFDLTKPERRTERAQRRRIAERVKACGGCAACKNRGTQGWGLALCGLAPPKTFPACVGHTPGFDPDHDVLYRDGHE